MRTIVVTPKYKKELLKCERSGRNYDFAALATVINQLAAGKSLPKKFRDHALKGDFKVRNVRECHIQPDWLLCYRIEGNNLILEDIGSHSRLFGMERQDC